MMTGLTVEQTNRILDDFKRKAHLLKTLEIMVKLLAEEDDALYNDIKGMLEGNNGKNQKDGGGE